MAPTYNGWEDTPEDEREALDQWEAVNGTVGRSSRPVQRPSATVWVHFLSQDSST
jgi:hypothetical protein